MSLYETTIILRSELAGSDVERISDEVANIVTEKNGKVIKKEIWGLKDLAYKINKNKKGHYVFYNLEANGEIIDELNRKLKISEDVIRSLNVKVKEFNDNAVILEDE